MRNNYAVDQSGECLIPKLSILPILSACAQTQATGISTGFNKTQKVNL